MTKEKNVLETWIQHFSDSKLTTWIQNYNLKQVMYIDVSSLKRALS